MAQSMWNEEALSNVFHQGLSPLVKDELEAQDSPKYLDEFIFLATSLDCGLWERRLKRAREAQRSSHTMTAVGM